MIIVIMECFNYLLIKKKTWVLGLLTRVSSGDSSNTSKITRALSLAFLLEIAIYSVRTVSPHCIGKETGCILSNEAAVSPRPACVVQRLLQRRIAHPILADTPCCTYSERDTYIHNNI